MSASTLLALGFLSIAQAKADPGLQQLSDADLEAAIQSSMTFQSFVKRTVSPIDERPNLDACLREAVRRGGKKWEASLAAKARAGGESPQIVLLSALRRLQGKSAPVDLLVEGDREVVLTWPAEHTFRVALRLAAGEQEPVAFMKGGDYRSGRQERFRIEARDAGGKVVPPRERLDLELGGLCSFESLKPGDAWKTDLDLASYVHLPGPGTYRLRIQYHDRHFISDLEDVSPFLLCASRGITVRVEPRTVRLSAEERKDIAGWIAALDPAEPLKALTRPYAKESHDLIPADSPAGKILSAGWKAVPGLVEETDRENLDARKAAWLFSLLFAVTGLNDPCRFDVIGPYAVDRDNQQKLARRWREMLRWVRVESE